MRKLTFLLALIFIIGSVGAQKQINKKLLNQETKNVFTTHSISTKGVIFSEDFSSGSLPTNWQNIDNDGSSQIWEFDNPGGRTINTETSANGFAILDSDNYGSGGSQNADLITPTIDCSSNADVVVEFQHYFRAYSGSSGTFFYSVDDGATWAGDTTFTASTANAETFSWDLTTELAGQATVKFKWNYTGSWGYYWAVDDIVIYEPVPYDFSISTPAGQAGEVATSVFYDITIENKGTNSDDFTPGITGNGSWSYTLVNIDDSTALVSPITLAPGEDTTFLVKVIVDNRAALDDTDTENITVTSAEGAKAVKDVDITTTAIAPMTAGYTQNFDSTPEMGLPNGWDAVKGSDYYCFVVAYGAASAPSQPNALYMQNGSSSTTYNMKAIMPEVSDFAGNWLVFYALANADTDLEIGTWDGSTFTNLETKTISGAWTEYSVDFSEYIGTDTYIVFSTDVAAGNTVFLDDVTWEAKPAYSFTITQPSGQWIEAGTSHDYKVYINNTGENTDNYTPALLGAGSWTYELFDVDGVTPLATPMSIAGLSSDSLLVRATVPVDVNLGDIDTETLQVTSADGAKEVKEIDISSGAIAPVSAPYTEDFEGNWAGWTVINNDEDSYSWSKANTYITPTHSGSYAAHGMGNNDDYLITPGLEITSANHVLTWWDKVESSSYNNTYSVLVSTGGTEVADFTDSITEYDCVNTGWVMHSIDLSAYNGNTIYVAFHQIYSASTYYGFGIDDVSLLEITPVIPASGAWPATDQYSHVIVENGVTLTIPAAKAEETCFSVTLEPGGQLTVEGTLNVENELIIESDGTGSGSLINTGTVNANSTYVQQFLAQTTQAWNWHYVTPPMAGIEAGIFPGVDPGSGTVYASAWDEATSAWSDITGAATALTSGIGYAVPDSLGAGTTVEYSGADLVSGTQTMSALGFNAGAYEGYHLLGNPFTAAIEASQLVVGDGTNWTTDIWIRTDGGFEEFNVTGGSGTFSVIPAMQGFWVRNDGVGDMEITMDPAKLVHNTQALYKNANNNEIQFELVDGDKGVIYLNEDATAGFEKFDTEKRFVNGTTEIWTMAADKAVAINGLSVEDEATIAVGFKTATAGTFTFNFTSMDEFDADFDVFLKDNQTGDITDLRKSNTYEFYSDVTDNTSRFSVIITKSATDIAAIANGASIYANNNTVYVNAANAIEGTLSVYDVSGKIVMSKAVNYNSGVNTFELNEASGVYIININSANVNLTEKVVIK